MPSRYKRKQKKEALTIPFLLSEVMDTFHQMLRENPYDSGKNRDQIRKQLLHKKELRAALKNCVFGDRPSKTYVKDYIKEILVQKYKVDQASIEEAIPFSNPGKLSHQDKFEIVLYCYFKEYAYQALDYLIQENGLDQMKQDANGNGFYEITKEDVDDLYDARPVHTLTFNDKLNIVAQRIYENYKGNGPIDEIRDMKIDGVSGGVSGIPQSFLIEEEEELLKLPRSFDSIWIFYRGKSIYLSFLSFGSQKELMRICKNIYRYENPGQLSEVKGYTVNEMKDGSRVAVARPPFSESWLFFVRKFDSVKKEDLSQLITDANYSIPITLMKWLIKGCRIVAITGAQGGGKTTLLMALIGFINPAYNLRIHELSFELHLRKIYPERNIVTFRETGSVSGQKGLDFAKKSDGTVSILGEVASLDVSAWLVQMAQVASLFTLFTHHAKTTEDLVAYLRNALLQEGGFQNERIATEQVVHAIHFDIHMNKDINGHRYIERITEIIPGREEEASHNGLTAGLFTTRNLVIYQQGTYQIGEPMSENARQKIASYLDREQRREFLMDMEDFREKRCNG